MPTMYPVGYGTQLVTLEELQQRHLDRMEPEYARRLFAWLESKGGNIGIGGGWRPTPSNTSAASRNGHSFHQTQTYVDMFAGYSAVDLVHVDPGHVHRAPYWSEVPQQGTPDSDIVAFGVHCNVPGEPWHLQAVEQDSWSAWHAAGRPRIPAGYPIQGNPVTPPVPPPDSGGWPPFDPDNSLYSLYPLDTGKMEIYNGITGQTDLVRYLQGVLRNQCNLTIEIDGHFGSKTEGAVRQMQGWNQLNQDGRCGPKTWKFVDIYATR